MNTTLYYVNYIKNFGEGNELTLNDCFKNCYYIAIMSNLWDHLIEKGVKYSFKYKDTEFL